MYPISKKIRFFLLLSLIFQSHFIVGQESSFIYGILINADDQTPIPFVHITIKNKAKGTVSNMDGGFKIPDEYFKLADTLVVSSIGYSSKTIALSSLNQNLRNVINLVRKEEVLDEITLGTSKKKARRIANTRSSRTNRISAEDIIQLALDQIPKNYPFKPFSYVGYYRDYQLNKGNYINLNEAVMHVFDAGFGKADQVETQTRIYKYNKNTTFPVDTLANMPYDYDNERKYVSSTELGTPKAGRNEYTLLRIHDALRNYNINSYDFVNRLDLDFIKNHEFKFLPATSIDTIPLYAISFNKLWKHFFTATGKIFISKGDYKIYKMQYAIYDKSGSVASQKEQQANSQQSDKKEKKLGKLLYEIIVEYQLHKGFMFPNYISFNNSFQSLKPPVIFPKYAVIKDFGGFVRYEGPDIFKLTFSLDESQKKSIKKGNYRLWYKNKLLKIDKLIISKIDIVVFEIFKYTLLELTPYKMIEYKNQKKPKKQLNQIYDLDNYELYIGPYRSLNQYREFFVQELDTDIKKPKDNFYMIKDQPIFKNQPIAPKKNLEEYWMNTPLKN